MPGRSSGGEPGREPARLLVIRLGALGDVIRTLPAVRRLREAHPDARIAWLVEPKAADAVLASGLVDDVLVFPRAEIVERLRSLQPRRALRMLVDFVRVLRGRRFDVVFDFHGILKSGLLAFATGAPERIGYARPLGREGSWLFASHRARFDRTRLTRYERNAGLVACWLGEQAVVPLPPPVLAPEAERVEAMARALPGAQPIALVHPGSSPGTPHKRMPAERLAEVASRLSAGGHAVLVMTGPDPREQAEARRVVAAAGQGVALAPETPGFADLLALLSRAAVFVGADSAPLHLAALLGVRAVQLIGPTDPFVNQPAPQGAWLQVRGEMPCAPCRRGCIPATCMQRIEPVAVAAAVNALGRSEPAAARPGSTPRTACV